MNAPNTSVSPYAISQMPKTGARENGRVRADDLVRKARRSGVDEELAEALHVHKNTVYYRILAED